MEPKQWTLRELIAQLQSLPEDTQDLPVFTEGCDCWGEAAGVVVDNKRVVIRRLEYLDCPL